MRKRLVSPLVSQLAERTSSPSRFDPPSDPLLARRREAFGVFAHRGRDGRGGGMVGAMVAMARGPRGPRGSEVAKKWMNYAELTE